ncbi:MAG: hypothetical protein AAGJ81_02040 [Verrucomicrobiota bacterium]
MKVLGFLVFTIFGSIAVAKPVDADRYASVYRQFIDSPSPLPDDSVTHFVFLPRKEIRNHAFLNNDRVAGAQVLYPWTLLEPSRGIYDFSAIQEDLDYLESKGKKLFIQLQDTSFVPDRHVVPPYLRTSEFDVGEFAKRNPDGLPSGWIAKRWNANVRERFGQLLKALGEQFDGKIEGINLPETAAEGLSEETDPSFTPEAYAEGIRANMLALKRAFPKSVAIQYANFMPGEWLPWNDRGYLRSVYEYGEEVGVGLGGPDLMVGRRSQLNHTLALMHENTFSVPLGIAVQRGNYIGMTGADVAPGEEIPIGEATESTGVPMLHAFAKEFLGVQYIFWQNEEPYFSRDVLTHLR